MPRQAHGRQLLAGSRDVTTGEELAAAIRDNVGDIRIIEHIDLSSIQSETASDQARGSRTLPDVLSPTSSIRVCLFTTLLEINCTKAHVCKMLSDYNMPSIQALMWIVLCG